MSEENLQSPEYWAAFWKKAQRNSILRQTQLEHPERWRRFYNEVAGVWDQMTGGGAAMDIAAGLLSEGDDSYLKGKRVIDVGCGAGPLSVALARRGARVTAVDDSPGMIGLLKERIGGRSQRGIHDGDGGIETRVRSWTEVEAAGGFEIAVAAFFPPAWEPEAVLRFERLSRGECAFILPAGSDALPLRTALWSAVMKPGVPGRSVLLPYLFNYLYSLGRRPDVKHFSWRAELDVDLETAVFYYIRYFAIFGCSGAGVEEQIRNILASFTSGGRIRTAGESEAVLLRWKPAPRPVRA